MSHTGNVWFLSFGTLVNSSASKLWGVQRVISCHVLLFDCKCQSLHLLILAISLQWHWCHIFVACGQFAVQPMFVGAVLTLSWSFGSQIWTAEQFHISVWKSSKPSTAPTKTAPKNHPARWVSVPPGCPREKRHRCKALCHQYHLKYDQCLTEWRAAINMCKFESVCQSQGHWKSWSFSH